MDLCQQIINRVFAWFLDSTTVQQSEANHDGNSVTET